MLLTLQLLCLARGTSPYHTMKFRPAIYHIEWVSPRFDLFTHWLSVIIHLIAFSFEYAVHIYSDKNDVLGGECHFLARGKRREMEVGKWEEE